jgi:transposase
VAAHTRKPATRRQDDEALPFFDESRVPVEVIELPAPETDGLAPEEYEVISHKESYRLAQRPGSYVVIKYRRPVIKIKASEALVCAAAPAGVIDGSRADVSFIAGLLLDKFAYHLPLYRQHQRLADAGITVSRPWLTQIAQQGIALLEPIYDAQFASIRESRVKSHGRDADQGRAAGPGKLKKAYLLAGLWRTGRNLLPVLPKSGDQTRRGRRWASRRSRGGLAVRWLPRLCALCRQDRDHPCPVLDAYPPQLLRGANRRTGSGAQALELIGELYHVEESHPEGRLSAYRKRDYRLTHAKPIVERFFAWVERTLRGAGSAPEQSADQGARLRPRPTPGWRSSLRPGRADRHQPPRTYLARHPHGPKKTGCSAGPNWAPNTSA